MIPTESLTTAELKAIEDQLAGEQLLIKKLKAYSQAAQDPQIKTTCEQTAAQHKNHFDTLMSHLNTGC